MKASSIRYSFNIKIFLDKKVAFAIFQEYNDSKLDFRGIDMKSIASQIQSYVFSFSQSFYFSFGWFACGKLNYGINGNALP